VAQIAEATTPGMTENPAESRRWRPYQIYLIIILTLVSTSNYMDRMIVPILQEVIKADLQLTDTQLGLLTGPAFALLYSMSGIPIARLAERVNRRKLLSVVVALWSAMTALCGLAPSYFFLAMCRVGVGMGEGGCIPISHSLISDYFRPNQRGLAMAIFSTSAPIAGILIPIAGAYVAHIWGWRVAFMVVGLPGLLVSLLVFRTLREPRVEGGGDSMVVEREAHQSFRADLKWLMNSRAFVYLFLAGAFTGLGNMGTAVFIVSFFSRVHEFTIVQAGSVVALNGVMGLIGTFVGGYFADRYASPAGRSYPIVCAVGMAMAFVFYLAALYVDGWMLALGFVLIANIGTDLKNGPAFATVQNIAPVRMRATAAALYMFAATLIGTGFGPLIVGTLSDVFAQHVFAFAGDFTQSCPGGRAPAGAIADLARACAEASALGLRRAMAVICFMYIGATVTFFLAARSLRAPAS
jgi:MFS transporter, Spinster family, sphingosine-1-phosphate transporter